jgi:hypothetical protein
LSPEKGFAATKNSETVKGNLESITKDVLEKSDRILSFCVLLMQVSQRLRAFLPQMEEANGLLATQQDVNLEEVDDDAECIEMVYF